MTNKIGKKNLALVLVLALIFTAAFMGLAADKAEAASAKMNKSSLTLSLDKTTTAMLKAQGLSGKITWSVSDTKVLAVKSSGTKSAKVTAKSAGRTVVYAKAGGNTCKCTVTVLKKDSSYYKKLNKTIIAAAKGNTDELLELSAEEGLRFWAEQMVGLPYLKQKFGGTSMTTEGYLTTEIGASQLMDISLSKNGSYRIVREKTFASYYSKEEYNDLKECYYFNMGMNVTEAKVIDFVYNGYSVYDGKLEKNVKSSVTMVKADGAWYYSPGFVQWEMMDMTNDYLNSSPEDTFTYSISKEVLKLHGDGQVKVLVDHGEYEGDYYLTCETQNGIVETEWGEWNDDGSIMLYIYPYENGEDILYIYNSVNDFVSWINVTVSGI